MKIASCAGFYDENPENEHAQRINPINSLGFDGFVQSGCGGG
jgi:hypothetical protein